VIDAHPNAPEVSEVIGAAIAAHGASPH